MEDFDGTQSLDNDSSQLSENVGGENTNAAVNESSANSSDAKSADTSKAQDEKKVSVPSAAEILGKGIEPAKDDEEAAGKSTEAKLESGEAETEKAGDKDEQPAKTDEAANETNALFHKRPEWKELTTVLGEEGAKKARPILRKLLERETKLSTELTQAKPDVEEIKALRSVVGDGQNWKFYKEVTEGFAKGDAKLIPVLENMLNQMRQRNGLVVHSQDIKQKVDAGELDENAALAIEKERAKGVKTQDELQQTRQQQQAEQERSFFARKENALNQWESSVREKDPDFGNVTDENDPQHGESIADQVLDAIEKLRLRNPRATDQEELAVAERAKELAKRRIAKYAPQPKSFKPLTSNSSSRTAKPAPKSWREAADAATGILAGSMT